MAFKRYPQFKRALNLLIASLTLAGSMLRVSGSTSTSMGRAPTCSITLTPEQNVIGVVRTASPGPIPRLTSARCKAAVQELNARAAGAFTAAANSSSKRFTLGPVVIQSERKVSTTSAISSSLMQGGEQGRNSLRILRVLKAPGFLEFVMVTH